MLPANSKSPPPRGVRVNAQYALHVWDRQEDLYNPSLQGPHPYSPPRVSIVSASTLLSPQHLFFTEPPHNWLREYRVKSSIFSQRTQARAGTIKIKIKKQTNKHLSAVREYERESIEVSLISFYSNSGFTEACSRRIL